MIHILIADDDIHIRTLLRHYLQQEGYLLLEAEDGAVASHLLETETIHLAIVDIMMPYKNGYELCEEIRRHYDIPVIILSAKEQLLDKERGFLAGTDDYLVKPFEPKELLFRVKALLRRYQLVHADIITVGDTLIDRRSYEVRCGGSTILLPLKEFELLAQLASHPGRTFTREQLIDLIWGIDFEGDARTVDVHVKRLRERFSNRTHAFIISTVRGVGYKLEVKAF
ncbi:response regulator transcription factor [Ectobacillus antri]|jgi:two-component system OmpR family response regulator|uniref:Heme response regulator HssR n=1 Tax=Ectobacillus antri TaxID=2486280 RepID=A0ABT6H672_9BACI|nr:response regulator transcription factor [Ectobacillus antri]MDG4657020.1 response regulator transcription factor [Ectobacillus antri]MDG5754122.1 response regulator transcription factor [Ectobacillus antri]